MVCTTVRSGKECPFMTKNGCSYNGGNCHQVVKQCDGCSRASEFSSGWYCSTFPDPSLKWKVSNCNLASHVALASSSKKPKLNPLKASKRRR